MNCNTPAARPGSEMVTFCQNTGMYLFSEKFNRVIFKAFMGNCIAGNKFGSQVSPGIIFNI